MNAGGTIIQFPFGYICTFPSRRHLFRGEASEYPYSESSLSRRCRNKNGNRLSKREIEILHVISNMRIVQFHKYKLDEADYDLFPTIESLRDTLEGSFTSNLLKSAYGLNNCKISFQSDEVDYPISDNTKKYINDQYNDKSFLDPVGNILHETYPSRQYRREIYRNIYGEYPPEES